MTGTVKIQSISESSLVDVAHAISALSDYEIGDFFLMVAEKMDNPESIKICADRLRKNCQIRFGV